MKSGDTVWVTKYVLSSGVKTTTVDRPGSPYARVCWPRAVGGAITVAIGIEAFSTEAEARSNVDERLKKKLASLDKSRAKVLAYQFEAKAVE